MAIPKAWPSTYKWLASQKFDNLAGLLEKGDDFMS